MRFKYVLFKFQSLNYLIEIDFYFGHIFDFNLKSIKFS